MVITATEAVESDAPILASITTACFGASDPAYRIIWGDEAGPKWDMHDEFAMKGLFTPVQKDGRVTFKAVDEDGKAVGFATWVLPKVPVPKVEAGELTEVEDLAEKKKSGGLPVIPGIDLALFLEKMEGSKTVEARDVNPEDMLLSLLFVHPDYQRQGIGSLLMKWGMDKADELGTKCWLASSPQARLAYEKNGWTVVDLCPVDLRKYGGEGIYERAWMVRLPKAK